MGLAHGEADRLHTVAVRSRYLTHTFRASLPLRAPLRGRGRNRSATRCARARSSSAAMPCLVSLQRGERRRGERRREARAEGRAAAPCV